MGLWFPPGVSDESGLVGPDGLRALVLSEGSLRFGCRILDLRADADDHLPGSAWAPAGDLRPLRLPVRTRGFVVLGSAAEVAELRARGVRCWNAVAPPPDLLRPGRAPGALWQPDPLVVEALPLLAAGGRVLDLGCGVGRELTFLALHGHPGVGVDRLPDALELGAELAAIHGVGWEGVERRLGSAEDLPAGEFTLLLHLRVAFPSVLETLHERVAAGTVLVVRSYAAGPRRERFLLSTEELGQRLAPADWRFARGPERVEDGSKAWTVGIAVRV